MTLAPPYCSPQHVPQTLAQQGYAAISPQGVALQAPCSPEALAALCAAWDDLPPDTYLKDGGKYRRRRHSCFVVEGGQVRLSPHRAHWQPLAYNALHGGMQRWFEPVLPSTRDNPAWRALLLWLAQVADALRGPRPWFVEAHQFRIDTTDGLGRPTPEGAHRDGVDFVAVVLLTRHRIKGGETRVFEADGPQGQRFTLEAPWSLMLMDDARVIHESTPIQPVDAGGGHRDTLVLTFREQGFLGDDA